MSAELAMIGAGAASGVANTALNRIDKELFYDHDAARQLNWQGKMDEQSAGIQQKYGEMSADAAQLRQIELMNKAFEQTMKLRQRDDPKEVLRRIKEAGLSPSIMSQGLGSGSGQISAGSAPQGQTGGVRGSQADMSTPEREYFDIQNALVKAQIRNLDAQSSKNEADANKTKGVDTELAKQVKIQSEAETKKIEESVKNIEADTKLKVSQIKINELQENSLEIQNSFNAENNAILLKQNVEILRNQLYYNEMNDTLKENTIEIAKANLKQVLVNMQAQYKNMKLTDAQIDSITNSIEISKGQLELNEKTFNQNWEIEIMRNSTGTITKDLRGIGDTIRSAFGYKSRTERIWR